MNENISKTFAELEVNSEIIEKLNANEIITPSAVQAQAIPELSQGKSILFQSETGTGKTLAYLLPITKRNVKAIVLAPTIELASQIKTQAQMLGLKSGLLVGGAPIKRQIETLKEKPQIIIGGPARILELYHLKKLKLNEFGVIVLDEVDRLLAPELRDETVAIIESLNSVNKDSQLIACSATITKSTEKILQNAKKGTEISTLFLPPEDVLRKRITHLAVFADRREKIDTLRKILIAEKPQKVLIFTSKIDQVANIVAKLKYKNVECEGLHAKTDKVLRKSIIDKFRSGKLKALITSDLASRGLDIPNITHIIQMDFPSNDDFFIHRAGRTARAGKTGINIVIGDEYEMRKYSFLEKKLKIVVNPRMLYKGKLVNPETVIDKIDEDENQESKNEKSDFRPKKENKKFNNKK